MNIYRIIRNTAEKRVDHFRIESTVYPGCTLDEPDQYPEEISRYASAEEAREALKQYSADVRFVSGQTGTLAVITEYLTEEYEADDDGDFLNGSDYDVCTWPGEITVGSDTYRWDPIGKLWVLTD